MNSTRIETCPVIHQPEHEPPTVSIPEKRAQSFIDDPDHIHTSLLEFVTELEDAYSPILNYNPTKAAVKIARKVRSAHRGPVGAIFGSAAVEYLHHFTEEELEKYIIDRENSTLDFSTTWSNAKYHGAQGTWMKTMYDLHDQAVEAVYLNDSKAASRYIIDRLVDNEADVYELLTTAYRNDGRSMGFNWDTCTLLLDAMRSNVENDDATLDTLMAAYIAIVDSLQEDTPDADGIAHILYANMEPLTRGTSITKEALKKIYNNPNSQVDFPHIGHPGDIKRLKGIFRFDNGTLVPTHRSLRDGPWDPSGNCGGRMRLRVPDANTEHFFNDIGHPELGPDSEGRVQAVTLMLSAGIHIGRHTLFHPEKSLLQSVAA